MLSQQPVEQFCGVHFATHAPPEHVSVALHAWHEPPPVPQAVVDAVWQTPLLSQHPLAHEVGEQGTDVSWPPLSPASAGGMPASASAVIIPVSFGASADPSCDAASGCAPSACAASGTVTSPLASSGT